MTNQPRRAWRNTVCAAGPRCSPPGTVLSRAHIYGYGRSLRPPQGTSIAPRRRAVFRQALPEALCAPRGLYDPARGRSGSQIDTADGRGRYCPDRVGHLAPHSAAAPQDHSQAGAEARADDCQACSRVPAQAPPLGLLGQCLADDPVLLAQVCGRIALAGARTPGAADVTERDALGQVLLQAVTDRAPRPHVLGFLLRPDDLDQPRVRGDERGLLLDRERIELLDPRNRDVPSAVAELVPREVVIDLSGAEDEPAHLLLVGA